MSVIWSGVTEEGAVVPVQVTAEGKVVAVGDGPEGEYLKLTGGNLTGDLTVNEQITLATNGNAVFSGDVQTGGNASSNNHDPGVVVRAQGTVQVSRSSPTQTIFLGYTEGTSAASFKVFADGSASFAGGFIDLGSTGSATFAGSITISSGTFVASGPTASNVWAGYALGGSAPNSVIRADGSATFDGDVVIGSRGEKWLIRESNGVAMLVQQSLLKQPREIEKLRDLPNELDLIEAALSEIMEKLRMTPPAGWPVWDGQSEATSDNDNA